MKIKLLSLANHLIIDTTCTKINLCPNIYYHYLLHYIRAYILSNCVDCNHSFISGRSPNFCFEAKNRTAFEIMVGTGNVSRYKLIFLKLIPFSLLGIPVPAMKARSHLVGDTIIERSV